MKRQLKPTETASPREASMHENLLAELKELLAYVAEQNTRIKALDRQLNPLWPRQREIKARLTRSHHWISGQQAKAKDWRLNPDKDVVVGLRRETACERRDLFAEIDRLAVVYGPTRSLRCVAKLEADAALRAANRIRELLAKPPKPERRTRPMTGDLFT